MSLTIISPRAPDLLIMQHKTKEFYLTNPNLTNKQLATLANCSESTINKYKRELGLTFANLKEPTWAYKKLLEITPDSMYWMGFILADGCFSKETRKVRLSVSSSIIDEQHIVKLKNWLETENKLYYSKDNCCSLSVYSKKHIPEIMKFWNMSFRKTYVPYDIPDYLLLSKYFKYFIVGLIDGDGSIVTSGNTYKISITQHKSQEKFFSILNDKLMNTKHKLYLSDRDNTVNLVIQRPEIKNTIKDWYMELEDLPLKRKVNKMI